MGWEMGDGDEKGSAGKDLQTDHKEWGHGGQVEIWVKRGQKGTSMRLQVPVCLDITALLCLKETRMRCDEGAP